MTEAAHNDTPGRGSLSAVYFSATRSRFWLFCADMYPVLVAASIPWSTTAVAAFMLIWLVVLLPTIKPHPFLRSLRHPASFLPIAFFVLAVVGTLWAEGPWSERFYGIGPATKLLAIPFLLYHFQRSKRGNWVFVAFLLSCSLLLALSWVVFFAPQWKIVATETAGVPLKNSINQSQEFGLCILALAPLVLTFVKSRRFVLAALCTALLIAFFCNMTFVVLARTALVYMVPLIVLFAVLHLSRRAMLLLLGGVAIAVVLVWFASPYLRGRFEHVAVEYREYRETNRPTSAGQRIEYWTNSLRWISEAPAIGHGTGSSKQLFEKEALGKSGAWANSISNPHNQTLYVAVQWGLLGCIVLYAMWYFHLMLFRAPGLAAWIGLIVVGQNILSSILNSHLFDFHEGWIYALGVGVAGGMQQYRLLNG